VSTLIINCTKCVHTNTAVSSVTPTMLHYHFHLHASLIRRTHGRHLGTFELTCFARALGTLARKIHIFPYFRRLQKTLLLQCLNFLTQRNSRDLFFLQQSCGAEHSLWGSALFDMSGSDSPKVCLLKFARIVVTRRI
jgi:hypothetical protein